MITYQDMEEALANQESVIEFVKRSIEKHKSSVEYKTAWVADQYNRHKNVTISQYQKLLYSVSGQAVPDNFSANFKLKSNYFNRFVTQQNQYLLGNGVSWDDEKTEVALGDSFDTKLQDAGEKALVQAVAFGFWNLDHVEIFQLLEFVPLWDEETGGLRAGIRFWQLDADKPLRATLYEIDGYTEIIWRKNKPDGEILVEKRPYILKTRETQADGIEVYAGENYAAFPIVPFWGNKYHQSEFEGMRENIDAYDLIKSGFANDLDDVSQIYWIIENAGGMDDVDIAEFLQRIKTLHAANVDDGQKVTPQTINVPVEARETLLDRLRSDMYDDFMGLDTKDIASGAVTATQIEAAYEPINAKTDRYEYCVIDFIQGILKLAGVEDNPTFTRSMIVNVSENISNVIQAAEYLPEDYVTEKLLAYLGDADKVEDILQTKDVEDMKRFSEEE